MTSSAPRSTQTSSDGGEDLVAALKDAVAALDRLDGIVGPSSEGRCVECSRRWTQDVERWRTYLTDENELALVCPDCAAAEFGN